MELTRVNCGFSFLTNDGATRLIVAADALLANSSRTTDDREFCFSIRQTYGDPEKFVSSHVDAELFSHQKENDDFIEQLRGLIDSLGTRHCPGTALHETVAPPHTFY
jgi:hypothetical protein